MLNSFCGARGTRCRYLALRLLRRKLLLAAMTVAQVACVNATLAHATVIELGPTPAAGLPDGRVYEQVTPVEKNGNEVVPPKRSLHTYGVASSDGTRILYLSTGPIGEASSGIDDVSVSTRSSTGWSTRSALPQPPPAPRDPINSENPVWLLPSADRSSVVFTARDPYTASGIDFTNPSFSFASTYLSAEGGPAIWLGESRGEAPFPALEEVEDSSNLVLVGASENLSVVYYEYYGTLVPEDKPRRAAVEGGNTLAWGLYEWREGRLKAASILPSGVEDPDGAVAAAVGDQTLGALPSDFDNQVSLSGNTALFVSPDPESGSGRTPQLYARVDGTGTILISRSELTHEESLDGPDAATSLSQSHIPSYAFGSPDGLHVFFASEEQLTDEAPADRSRKEYEFDLATNTLSYLPGVTPPILASSRDGSTLVFDKSDGGEQALALWAKGHVSEVAPLPPPPADVEEALYVAPVTIAADGSVAVFQTNSPIPGFNDGEGYGEVYRYDLGTDGLSCVSCPPVGHAPEGSANLSEDDLAHGRFLTADSRGVSEDGSEIFFDTPEALVAEDTNEKRDVYEWHDGVVSLISSGKGPTESVFLDNSASGSDVFFATSDNLSGADTDGSYDIYDARIDGGFPSSMASPEGPTPPSQPPQITPSLASTSLLGAGEQVSSPPPPPHHASLPPSRAQKLSRSLRACRRRRGRARHTCEVLARRRYGRQPTRRHS